MDRSAHLPLAGRRIVLGITGGVAAYKAAELCRELVRRGAFVSPILTRGAEQFIGAATFSAIASEPARTSLWDSPEPSPHTDLGQRADLIVVAPATANLLAAARAGSSADLLTTTLLATRAPVLLCPAMHTEMWEHPATRDNVAMLQARGVHFVLPDSGELAGGDIGAGRLADPMAIADRVGELLATPDNIATADYPPVEVAPVAAAASAEVAPVDAASDAPTIVAPGAQPDGAPLDLQGMTVLVSAGGTREAIDPVRFIGNRSSGKQGHAIAHAALERGARVQLVTTVPSDPSLAGTAIEVLPVESAQQMHDSMLAHVPLADVIVMCAAVADFRPAECANTKLKRRDGLPQIELEPTPNILRAIAAERHAGQTLVGFAAETDHLRDNALEKLDGSGADLIVANDVSRADAGFEHDTNAVTIHRVSSPTPIDVPVGPKRDIAERVLDAALQERVAVSSRRPKLREVR
ncbi:MAG: phosphopantothenoylcysteine decarboxylase/phosphopantothenate--cysteine ligase [Thermoleophilia bacterium]|nr:phosphopantothenoylcysteine decarboxylase/phosphopantothenate--cysteine ligase [Thermoleophilia bacterium]